MPLPMEYTGSELNHNCACRCGLSTSMTPNISYTKLLVPLHDELHIDLTVSYKLAGEIQWNFNYHSDITIIPLQGSDN